MRAQPTSQNQSIHEAKQTLLNEDDTNTSEPTLDTPVDTNQYNPTTGWCAQWNRLTYNIRLILIYTFLWGAGISIWNRQLLAAYIFEISGNSTETLGYIEAVQGLSYLIAAIISGILTDRSSSRIGIIRFSGAFGLIIVVPIGVFTLLFVNNKYSNTYTNAIYDILYKGMYYIWLFLYGICSSFCNTIVSTVLTDLIPKGQRDFIFSFQWFIRRMASTLGPIIIVVMFYLLGNDWEIAVMNIILLSGIALWCVPLLMLIFGFNATELRVITALNDQKKIKTGNIQKDATGDDTEHRYAYLVKWILLMHRLAFVFGAGMTVKFFPIFFEDKIGLKPIALNSVYIVTPFTMAIFTIISERFSKRIGRPWVIITSKSIGIGCLVVMALVTSGVSKYADVIVVIAFIIRTGTMNCAYPLEKAILMDYVLKKNRGKWNALESINSTVWTLSAALGGYLVGSIGYREIYLITASIYLFTVFMLVPLIFITQ